MITLDDLKAAGYVKHHTAMKRGYVSRKGNGVIRPYKGRFGEGYVHLEPRWDTTSYCNITYYVKKESMNNDRA